MAERQTSVNVGGDWKNVDNIDVKVGGFWKTVSEIWVRVSGTWEAVFIFIQISPSSDFVSNFRVGECHAGVRYKSDGFEEAKNSIGGWLPTNNRGLWLDVGESGNVWVERTINSGSLTNEDPGAGRHNLGTTRTFSQYRVGLGTDTANVTFDFWSAASGGVLLDTVTFNISATRQTP